VLAGALAALATTLLIQPATAQSVGGAYVVTRSTVHRPAPQVVPVVITHQTHYVDLDTDYGRQGSFRIDDDHWLMKAQRIARSATRGRAVVIYGSPKRMMTAQEKRPQPRLIIQRPHHIPPKDERPTQPKPGQWVLAD